METNLSVYERIAMGLVQEAKSSPRTQEIAQKASGVGLIKLKIDSTGMETTIQKIHKKVEKILLQALFHFLISDYAAILKEKTVGFTKDQLEEIARSPMAPVKGSEAHQKFRALLEERIFDGVMKKVLSEKIPDVVESEMFRKSVIKVITTSTNK